MKNIINQNLKFINSLTGYEIIFILLPISAVIGNTVLNAFLTMFSLITLKKIFNNFKNINKNLIYFFFFFIFLLSINFYYSINYFLTGKSILALLNGFLLIYGTTYFINFSKITKELSVVTIFLIIFIAINILMQKLIYIDFFGNIPIGQNRSTAVFGDTIPGAFILKIFFLALISKFFFKSYLRAIYFSLFFTIIIFLTNERAASISILIFFIFFITLIDQINFFKKILIFLITLFIISLSIFIPFKTYKYFSHSSNHMYGMEDKGQHTIFQNLFDRSLSQFKSSHSDEFSFFNTPWGKHYITSYHIFKNNMFLGTGIRTFRDSCRTIDPKSCTTHQHNIYLEFLSDGGLFLFIPFAMFVLTIGFKLLKLTRKTNKSRYIAKIFLIQYLIMFNPFQPTGSIFASWNGFFYWFTIGIIINYLVNYKKVNENFYSL